MPNGFRIIEREGKPLSARLKSKNCWIGPREIQSKARVEQQHLLKLRRANGGRLKSRGKFPNQESSFDREPAARQAERGAGSHTAMVAWFDRLDAIASSSAFNRDALMASTSWPRVTYANQATRNAMIPPTIGQI
jgi:hypothetical protein